MSYAILNKLSFHPTIQSWFKDQFESVSPPQEKGWPSIAAGKHTLILAPTGSGKTLAAFLWSIDQLLRQGLQDPQFDKNPQGIHTLYISPLKALNNDIQRNLNKPLNEIAQYADQSENVIPNIRSMVRTGDTPPHLRQSMLKKPPHILITTPESLYLILNSDRGRMLFSNLRYLILDEIHSITTNKRGVHLSLSLERLMPLCKNEPVRIGLSATQKPLDRIAAFLGGQISKNKTLNSRPVSIIDCGQKKKMDLKVISPVPDFSDLPDFSVWPAVINILYDYILTHRTTLVFLNMRAQTEKIARQLNEKHRKKIDDPSAVIALSHHGSMSREMRFKVEEKLKNGKIPTVIATSSLELGIDIGSIDLVVQLESPKSISSALQRVGRSGHLLKASSKGRIIPLYQADLDDAAAITQAMRTADIEEVIIPENCLDVLAQQVVAEISAHQWPRKELYRLFKQSYCYRNLTLSVFDQVLEMLTGRYAESKLPSLNPVINWDRVNDLLIALPGSRLKANLNGGTIPDRGYYGVYLADTNIRLGEMEEEFVFESKPGDIFYLGNNEWFLEQITQDRIIVRPASSTKPRAPFWKGDLGYMAFETAEKVGAFREKILEDISTNKSIEKMASEYNLDLAITRNLIKFFNNQKSMTGQVPTNSKIVVEWFYDAADELNIVFHTPFGGRVNAPWAISVAGYLENHLSSEIQYSFDDDGFIFRVRESSEFPNIPEILNLTSDKIETLLLNRISSSPIFSIQFRYNAARSLLLTRSRPGKRIPLWLQRLRANDLLQAVKQYPDFPILVETYRSCLQDIFDITSLSKIIDRIHEGKITTTIIQTPYPSPMVSGLIFDFVSNQVYEQDRTLAPGEIATVSSDLLSQVIAKNKIPAILTDDLIKESWERWQHLTHELKAKDKEELFLIIKNLGPITENDLVTRSHKDVQPWLEKLKSDKRISNVRSPLTGIVATEDLSDFHNFSKMGSRAKIIRRYLENEGPVSTQSIGDKFSISKSDVDIILSELLSKREIVRGELIKKSEKTFWCNRDNFAQLYRRAISIRRLQITGVKRHTYLRFLLNWHGLSGQNQTIDTLINRYQGFMMPPFLFEREILSTRQEKSGTGESSVSTDYLGESIRNGDVIVQCYKSSNEAGNLIKFHRRGDGQIFESTTSKNEKMDDLTEEIKTVHQFLKENGASPFQDIESGTNLTQVKLRDILEQILRNGLISTDNYDSFLSLIGPSQKPINRTRGRSSRHSLRQNVKDQLLIKSGHWFLTSSYAVMGKNISMDDRLERQARILLQRYGILVKEFYRREVNFLPWHQLFQVLKRMEWQGEIRRGYFIEGLSGVQFALPEAIELLSTLPDKETSSDCNIICTIDPVLPFGSNIPWEIFGEGGEKLEIRRGSGNHLVFLLEEPVLFSENYGRKIWTVKPLNIKDLVHIANTFKNWLRLPDEIRAKKKIEIEYINEEKAPESDLAEIFYSVGFEKEGSSIVLWPSGL
jgi:ATP-dependent Lhr-like helicase